MHEIKINKEINGKTENGIEYKVTNLSFFNDTNTLFGSITIKEKSKKFYIDLENTDETKYDFQDNDVEDEFSNALADFNDLHITIEIPKNEKDKKENMA